jgi:hypothetical protein
MELGTCCPVWPRILRSSGERISGWGLGSGDARSRYCRSQDRPRIELLTRDLQLARSNAPYGHGADHGGRMAVHVEDRDPPQFRGLFQLGKHPLPLDPVLQRQIAWEPQRGNSEIIIVTLYLRWRKYSIYSSSFLSGWRIRPEKSNLIPSIILDPLRVLGVA